MKKSMRERRIEKRIRKTKGRKAYLRQRQSYLKARRENTRPLPPKPVMRPIPIIALPTTIEHYDDYIDIQFSYRAGKNDSSKSVRKPTFRIYGATRDTFNGDEYLAEKNALYGRNGGAAWSGTPDGKLRILGSGKVKR